MGIPSYLRQAVPSLTCMQVKNQQLEPDMEKQTGSKLGKGYVKVVYCYPVYLICMQSTSCKMPAWVNHKLESGRNINNLRYTDDTTCKAERGTKEPLCED